MSAEPAKDLNQSGGGQPAEELQIDLKKHNIRLRIAPDVFQHDQGSEGLSLPELEGFERAAQELFTDLGKQVAAGKLRVHASRDGEVFLTTTATKSQLDEERRIVQVELGSGAGDLSASIQEQLTKIAPELPSLKKLLARTELFAGPGSAELTKRVGAHLGLEPAKLLHRNFADGEYKYPAQETVQSKDLIVLMSCYGPTPGDRYDRFKTIIEGLERASARSITAVMPYFPFARQERRAGERDPITARRVADELVGVGVSRLITVDIHTLAIEGFFPPTVPVTNLSGAAVLAPYLKENFMKDMPLDSFVAVSPDFGGDKRSARFATLLGLENTASIEKRRDKNDKIVAMKLHGGEVRGKTCFIFDDIVDSGGTIIHANNLLRSGHEELVFQNGVLVPKSASESSHEEVAAKVMALKELGAERVIVAASHPVHSNNAVERLESSGVDAFVYLDTIPFPAHPKSGRWHQVSVAPLIAAAVARLRSGNSLSELQGQLMPYGGGIAGSGAAADPDLVVKYAEVLRRSMAAK